LQTIYPAVFRKAPRPAFERERIILADGDFLDLDWLLTDKSKPLAILCHGLEGSSDTNYINLTAAYLYERGINILAWNYRGCSGEMNRSLRFYHSGETGDLDYLINLAIQRGYNSIVLVGFSLGGNVVLKYTGEREKSIRKELKCTIAVSAPIDLGAAAIRLEHWSNKVYLGRFLTSLKKKVIDKSKLYPSDINISNISRINDFYAYDDAFTAPIHGFKDAKEYYAKSSSRQFLPDVSIPALLIQPKDDPFLPWECFPIPEAKENPNFYLEMPRSGGHLGFLTFGAKPYYPAVRVYEFISEHGR
jgi:hypothetical protein